MIHGEPLLSTPKPKSYYGELKIGVEAVRKHNIDGH